MSGPPKTSMPGRKTRTTKSASAPWKGRKRSNSDAKDKFIAVRCTAKDRQHIDMAAREAGLALGNAGPRAVKRPRVEREQLARLLGEIGKLGSNVNQIAKWSNTQQAPAASADLAAMRADIAVLRSGVMTALDRHGD